MLEEKDLGLNIVHGWFTHRGDSILSTFLTSLKEKRSYKATNEFLGES